MNPTLFLNIGTPELFLILISVGLPIYCLFDIVNSTFKDSTTKLLWVLIVLFAPCIGCIIYLLIGKKNKMG